MKRVLSCAAITLCLAVGAWQSVANEPKAVPFIGPSDGPMPELLCATPNSTPKENSLFKLSCHEKSAQPCLPSSVTLPLQQILHRFAPAKMINIRLKGDGCYELVFIRRPKP
jgi:hypothetical protein